MATVSEDMYTPASSTPSSSKSQFNGDIQEDLNHSASMENISSIHNNIFYKTFGKPVKYPSTSSSKPITSNDERSTTDPTNDNDDNMEYRPVSGFVHRLMGRFSKGDSASSASATSPSSATLSKRFSSMEDISADSDSSKKNVSFEETTTVANPQKQSVLMSSNLSHRARSIESLSSVDSSRKSQSQSSSRPLAIPHLRHIETKHDKDKPLKSPRESKVIAPDVDLGRDDIIIIEKTPSVPALQLSSSGDQHNDSGSDLELPQFHSYREEMLSEELPKPNTVFTVRSIFETAASSVSATPSSALAHRRRKSDSSDVSIEKPTQGSSSVSSETSNSARISNRITSTSISSPTLPVLSPRITTPNEPSTSPVFKLDQTSTVTTSTSSSSGSRPSYSSQRSPVLDLYSPRSPVLDLYSPHYGIPKSSGSDGKSQSLSGSAISSTPMPAASSSTSSSLPTSYTKQLSSSRQSTPRDDSVNVNNDSSSSSSSLLLSSSSSSSSATETSKLPSVVERGSLFDSRPAPSPRSTASVKPTIAQNPPIAVKPIPLSAPASAATSYKKSSPVVPVAPFKKREETEDDGTPVLIYQKAKSPRSKPERQNLNNINGKQVKESQEEKDDLIIPKDAKKVFDKEQKKNNEITSSSFDLKGSNDNNFKSNNDSKLNNDDYKNDSSDSVISVTKDRTVINLTRTNNTTTAAAATDNTDYVDGGMSQKFKNNFAPSAPIAQPTRPPRSKNNINNTEPTGKSRPAPLPPKPSSAEEVKKPEETEKKKEGSMIYISSSESGSESESSTPPQTPRTRPSPPEPCEPPPPMITPSPRDSAPVIPPSPREQPPPVKTREIPSISPSPRIHREPPSTSPAPHKPRIVPETEPSDEKPVKGIPSIIANRLNKGTNSPREISDAIIDREKSSNGRDSPDAFSVNLRKIGSGASITTSNKTDGDENETNKRDSVSNAIEAQIANMRKKMDNSSKNRSGGGAKQIFDSSQLAQKRKERKEAAAKAAAAASAQGIVPPLDFSSLNDDARSTQAYLRRKEIKPCNIKFIGENAPTSRNLLKKRRAVKINIQFREDISNTFEYPSEDTALQAYLEEHPHEPEEDDDESGKGFLSIGGSSSSSSSSNGGGGILFLSGPGGGGSSGGGGGGGGFGESSDDVDVDDDDEDNDVTTPRGGRRDDDNVDDGFKSNPALSSTSTLQSYRGRFQEEFVFGSHRQEPEPVVTKPEPEPVVDPDSMMLRPAEEETVDTWSTNSSSDLLF